MRRSTALVAIVVCVVAFFSRVAFAESSVDEARRRVTLLQFLRGLHLTPAQIESLRALHATAESLRSPVESEAMAEERQLAVALSELESLVAAGASVPDSLKRTIRSLNERDRVRRRQLSWQMRQLETRAEELLTENQRYVARTAKLCLIPPTPGAIGQDRGTVAPGLERQLRRLRECPERKYARLRERQVERFARELHNRRPDLPADSLCAEKERIRQLLDSVRRMEEGTFLASLPEIASQLHDKLAPEPRRYKTCRVGRLLMDPLVPELLTELREDGSRDE